MGCMTVGPVSLKPLWGAARKFGMSLLAVSILLLMICSVTTASAQEPAADGQALFAPHEVLALTLEADFDQLKKDRDQESEEREGRIMLTGSDGQPISLTIQVKTRGNFRLRKENCSLPPLRLNLPGEGLDGTVMEGQDKLKLVTHCRDNDNYQQNVLEEYLAYRMYNLFTPKSFRVRLARVTYVDSKGDDDRCSELRLHTTLT